MSDSCISSLSDYSNFYLKRVGQMAKANRFAVRFNQNAGERKKKSGNLY